MGGGRKQGAQGKKKVKPLAKVMEVTLEDLYNGKELEFDIERHRICEKCNGVGSSDPNAV